MQPLSGRYCRNYLRACGEYSEPNRVAVAAWELPPRARRIPRCWRRLRVGRGTTSACAENTPSNRCWWGGTRNYLRMRGEYFNLRQKFFHGKELPPHTRRIHIADQHPIKTIGTTSACAENTWCRRRGGAWLGNYLRMRGEYIISILTDSKNTELPPRARRIRGLLLPNQRAFGTTSACAENTVAPHRIVSVGRNYLRVRGEYIRTQTTKEEYTELPPRARRIQSSGVTA